MDQVIKRDGRVEEFNINKVIKAITKAMKSTEGGLDEVLAEKIAKEIEQIHNTKNVEEIQDLVEKKLMASSRKDVAKAYIIYRNDRTMRREMGNNIFNQVIAKTTAQNIENSNANVDEASFGGRKQEASSIIQKEIAMRYLMSPDVLKAYKEHRIYPHDFDSYAVGMHNCLFIDFKKIFTEGFKTRNGDVRPPNNFSTACQLVAVAFQCQSQVQFGGVGSVHLDYDLAPFVKKSFRKHMRDYLTDVEDYDKEHAEAILSDFEPIEIDNKELINQHGLSAAYNYAYKQLEKEGRQAAQGLYHNLNTLESRQGSQVPFTSINIGRDTSTEGRLVTKWLLEASLDGIGKHHLTSIFPISIFQFKNGVNAKPSDPNYDLKQLALKSLSKRIYPNFCNGDFSEAHEDDNDPDTFFATMGCRTMLGYDRHGYGYNRVGRGNNIPTTIILPKLGIEHGICLGDRAEPDFVGFFEDLENTLSITEKALVERYQHLASQSPGAGTFMYMNGTIKDSDKCVENVHEALKHNTLAIGYIGIAETCQAMFGENHVHSAIAYNFAMQIVQRMSNFVKEAAERNDLNFSLYATPAEGLCRTALINLRKEYGIIKNITDREYITNSHHVPVWEKVSIYEKLRTEAPFCKYPTGGCITYIECESTFMENTKAIEDIIDYAFNELNIPYLAINFPIDSCLDCGYQSEFNDACPECNSCNIQQLRRVTGYLTTDYRHFNDGKIAEVEDRYKHTSSIEF